MVLLRRRVVVTLSRVSLCVVCVHMCSSGSRGPVLSEYQFLFVKSRVVTTIYRFSTLSPVVICVTLSLRHVCMDIQEALKPLPVDSMQDEPSQRREPSTDSSSPGSTCNWMRTMTRSPRGLLEPHTSLHTAHNSFVATFVQPTTIASQHPWSFFVGFLLAGVNFNPNT